MGNCFSSENQNDSIRQGLTGSNRNDQHTSGSNFQNGRTVVDNENLEHYLRQICANDVDQSRVNRNIPTFQAQVGPIRPIKPTNVIKPQPTTSNGHVDSRPSNVPSYTIRPQQPSTSTSFSHNGQYNKNKKITSNVYEGISSGRKVAVKIDQASKIDREIQILSTLDHENILRFLYESSMNEGQKVLISEFYERPLSDCTNLQIDVKLIMHQLASAIEYLQRKKVLHLNVSPDNIFFVKRDVEYVVKLTNFSQAEKMMVGLNCRRNLCPDIEYSAPELKLNILDPSSDIWSLGKVFIFIMLKMGHGKVQKGKKMKKGVITTLDINQLKNDSNDCILCKHMLEKILVVDAKSRVTASEILKHPFFWCAQKTRDFILDIAKMLEGNNNQEFRTEIYRGSPKVMGGKDSEWTTRIPKKLLEELKKARKAYCSRTGANNDDIDGKKITSLITTIRNMIVHTKTAEVISIVGDDDETFIKYWTSRFPNLILHLYDAKTKYENKENLN